MGSGNLRFMVLFANRRLRRKNRQALFCAAISAKNFEGKFSVWLRDFLNIVLSLVARSIGFDDLFGSGTKAAEPSTSIAQNRCARGSNLLAFALETPSDLCDTKFLTEKVL
jgi:hypothetical protein